MDGRIRASALSILQRGITHARTLCLMGDIEIAVDLLDALDNLPELVDHWSAEKEARIRDQLVTFGEQHPEQVPDYAKMFDNRTSIFR